MSGINLVSLSGRVSRTPRRVRDPDGGEGHVYVFPLAVRGEEGLVFPYIVVSGSLPQFVTYDDGRKLHEQPLVTVVGRTRTRNLTRPLAEDLAAQARRAGAPEEVVAAIRQQLRDLGDLRTRRVVTEILAESVLEGGAW